MIYFDNAASGGFKPESVYHATASVMKNLLTNSGRSGHSLSVLAESLIYEARKKVSKYVNNGLIDRLIFTPSCTHALNYALFGLISNGDEVITSVTEHNSVLRPLYMLERDKNVTIKYAKLNSHGFIDAESVLSLITNNTKAVVLNAVSNVTGIENQYVTVGRALKNHNKKIYYVVDGAQAAGHTTFDMISDGIDALCLAGHKGLFSYQGIGVLALSDTINLNPTIVGGTGSETFEKLPTCLPELLEPATPNLAAIISLLHGVEFAINNLEYHCERLTLLTDKLISGLSKIPNVKIYSTPNKYGIVSFLVDGINSVEFSQVLSDDYFIAVRGGFHCAPLLHKSLKTADNGLIRASLSNFNTEQEINLFLNAVSKIASDLL